MGLVFNGTSGTDKISAVDGTLTIDGVATVASPTVTGDLLVPDKIVHTGDTNTQIRFPSVDTITAETAGSERLRITSAGKVGINETSPDKDLHITGASSPGWKLEDTTNTCILQGYAQDSNACLGTYSNHDLWFATNSSERLRISAAGKVLIGDGSTYSANGLLHIVGDDNSNGPELYLQVNNNNTTDNIGALWFGNNVDKSLVKLAGHTHTANNTADFTVSTSSGGTLAERLRIDSDGNVFLKDSAGQGNSLVNYIRATDSSGNSQYTLGMLSTGNEDLYLAQHRNAKLRFQTNGSSRWIIDGDPGHLTPAAANTVDIGSTSAEIRNLFIGDSGQLQLGSDQDLSIYHNGSNGYLKNSTGQQLYRSGTHTFESADGSDEYIRITSAGNLGIGLNAPLSQLEIGGASNATFQISPSDGNTGESRIFIGGNSSNQNKCAIIHDPAGGYCRGNLHFCLENSGDLTNVDSSDSKVVIMSDGKMGVGITPFATGLFHVGGHIVLSSATNAPRIIFEEHSGTDPKAEIRMDQTDTSNGNLLFYTEGGGTLTERLRIDSSGRLLIGKTSGDCKIDINSSHYVVTSSGKATTGINIDGTAGNADEYGGGISFQCGSTGAAAIAALQGGSDADNVGLAFFTHPSGTGSADAVEQMRIRSDGEIVMGTASSGSADTLYVTGPTNSGQSTVKILGNGNNSPQANTCALDVQQNCTSAPNTSPALKLTHTNTLAGNEGAIMSIYTNINNGTAQTGWVYHTTGRIIHNRPSTDGTLFSFRHNDSSEGNISISGSTVSYNGGHLSRWSQFVGLSTTSKAARPTIYQGTVLSNLDEMCEWTGEDNQQLNKTKVSDTVGDKDVAGVFWTWDEEDDGTGYVNDFYVAMTGDMVIRVAGSTSVARGDLLESAGDGTAKPQSDDIIRSKTIAKIISTTSTATYADGSKAYPCVLMAC